MEYKKTVVVNLIGAPGTGKSTIASELFAKMKWAGFNVELVSEYAKELVWEERGETFKDELYLFAKQHHRLFRLKGKVDFVITDRPLILSIFYNKMYGKDLFDDSVFQSVVLDQVRRYQNLNILLKRTKKYVANGRNQNEEESNAIFEMLYNDLGKYTPYEVISADSETADVLFKIIKSRFCESV